MLLILPQAGWGRAVLAHIAIGISQVILLCRVMFLGQQGYQGHVAQLGLSTGLESGIPGSWPSSVALS